MTSYASLKKRRALRKKRPRQHGTSLPRVVPRDSAAKKSPRKAVARSNRKRRQSAFKRAYLSAEFVKFVQARPCAVCGVRGYSQAAHTKNDERKGMGQKRSWKAIAPLCGPRLALVIDPWSGCHHWYDNNAWFRALHAATIGAAITALHSDWQSRAARAG